MTSYNNLKAIPKNEFPLFLTVRKLIYMLDGNCNYSFFSRDPTGKIYGMDSSSEWHSESKEGALMINQYQKDMVDFDMKIKLAGKDIIKAEEMDDIDKIEVLQAEGIDIDQEQWEALKELEDEDEKDVDREDQIKTLQDVLQGKMQMYTTSKMTLQQQLFSKEVDFEMFEKHFWHKNKGGLKLSAINVWTEIFSVIKGGLQSFRFGYNYYHYGMCNKNTYFSMKSSMEDYISQDEKNRIYLLYVKYEDWKYKNHYYDFMDVVRHVIRFYPFHNRQNLDYLVVDEVQDLTPLTIQLLIGITNKNVFFCGDTAQTIAKGVGFKFHDLKTCFENRGMKPPKVVQLTRNYRSHNSILEMANSIVDLIEHFFPKTIDRLDREESDIEGPKPIILQGYEPDDLIHVLKHKTGGVQPRFGCNQVVIVRNQETKKLLPLCLQSALCLTVYEAKGLEFDDVILYNFFSDSTIDQKLWRLFNDIEIVEETRRVISFENGMTINELDINEYNEMVKRLKEEEENGVVGSLIKYQKINKIKSKELRDDVNRQFGLLCVELKHLYVSITRPKNKLIIYDTEMAGRRGIYDYWINQGVADSCYQGEEHEFDILKDIVEEDFDEEKSKTEWRAIGLRLFKKKFYHSVITCFEHSGDEDLKIRTLGYMNADEASILLSEAETLLYAAKHNKTLKRMEKTDNKKKAKELKKQSKELFRKAGDYFNQIKLHKSAAQCYYTSADYDKAADLFFEAKQLQQAADCYMKIKNYSKAARMFEECNLPLKAFE